MNETSLAPSNFILESIRKINIIFNVIIITIGLIGHSMTIFLFSHKIYRNNSSNVYLFCLAVIDFSFIIVHGFEDVLRTYIDINQSEIESNIIKFLKFINLTDNFDISCKLVSFLRYQLRFISAYIIVAFTGQRTFIVHYPLQHKFKSSKSGWLTVFYIFLISVPLNLWVFFYFELNTDENQNKYCDIKRSFKIYYFRIIVAYITCIMLIPIILIFIGNGLIIKGTLKADLKRKQLGIVKSDKSKVDKPKQKQMDYLTVDTSRRNFTSHVVDNNHKLKIFYVSKNQLNLKNNNVILYNYF
jgi:hypothetical protein